MIVTPSRPKLGEYLVLVLELVLVLVSLHAEVGGRAEFVGWALAGWLTAADNLELAGDRERAGGDFENC